jgi:pyruvate formate lyase activating enzyme
MACGGCPFGVMDRSEAAGAADGGPAGASAPVLGFVHSTEPGSAVDGPGMRFLVFLAGCEFRCIYCHNPDTWTAAGAVRRSVADVADEIGRYLPWIRRTGGVTVSGGEPLMQSRFVEALFREVKARWGLHTAVETQGHLLGRLPDSWFEPLDLALLDIKHIDEEGHRALTGGFPLEPTLEAARRLGRLGKDIWIRHVVVPGYTDRIDVAERLAAFVSAIPTVRRVELLPFHQLGRDKWKELGIPYPMERVVPPDPALVEALRAPFRARGLETC